MSPELERRLNQAPFDFDFFQAVRLLQLDGATRPVGLFSDPAREAVRFASHPSLAFPPAEVMSLERAPEQPPRMTTTFFGLTGATGVLPTLYTAFLIERLAANDTTLNAFVGLFQHRIESLFYRAWEKYRFAVPYERNQEDSLSGHLLDLIGLGTAGLQNRQDVEDEALMGYAGLLGQMPRSQSALSQILRDYFDVPVEVISFAGTWRKLDKASLSRLDEGRGISGQLGLGTVLGDEVWDEQSVVRIRMGPLTLAQYQQFLPDGHAYKPLRAIQRFFCGDDLDVEVQLVLKREETPRFGLGMDGQQEPRLGWISWMFSKPLERDPDETVLRLWDS